MRLLSKMRVKYVKYATEQIRKRRKKRNANAEESSEILNYIECNDASRTHRDVHDSIISYTSNDLLSVCNRRANIEAMKF